MGRWLFAIAAAVAVACGGSPVMAAPEGLTGNPDLNRTPSATAETGDIQQLHVPIAGEAYQTTFLGKLVTIPPRNRENVLAMTLGANLYAPEVGGDHGLPIAALYWRQRWDEWWTRDVFGLFVNEMDVARSCGRFQLLGHLENNTVPTADTDIKDGKKVTSSSVARFRTT